jgi:hypothetical protein
MKDAVEMGSGAMICTPSFVETGSGIQNLIEGGFRDSMVISKTYLYFFKIMKVG